MVVLTFSYLNGRISYIGFVPHVSEMAIVAKISKLGANLAFPESI
jgi:hypothetical protein